jgi:hypothetical protein
MRCYRARSWPVCPVITAPEAIPETHAALVMREIEVQVGNV